MRNFDMDDYLKRSNEIDLGIQSHEKEIKKLLKELEQIERDFDNWIHN